MKFVAVQPPMGIIEKSEQRLGLKDPLDNPWFNVVGQARKHLAGDEATGDEVNFIECICIAPLSIRGRGEGDLVVDGEVVATLETAELKTVPEKVDLFDSTWRSKGGTMETLWIGQCKRCKRIYWGSQETSDDFRSQCK
jgi:hypothetical protein